MANSIEQQLQTLPTLSKTELAELWQELFKSTPDPKIRKPMVMRFLAYRIQEQKYGSLSASAVRKLRQVAGSITENPDVRPLASSRLRSGTRLVREWQGQVHLVNVESSGYEYRGVRYRSLSEIARLITGTRWSGPLFFGIKSTRADRTLQEAQ